MKKSYNKLVFIISLLAIIVSFIDIIIYSIKYADHSHIIFIPLIVGFSLIQSCRVNRLEQRIHDLENITKLSHE